MRTRDALAVARDTVARLLLVGALILMIDVGPPRVAAGGLIAGPDVGPSLAAIAEIGAINQVNELSKRRRLTTFFFNEQSPFYGVQINYVNAERGNLTFLNRDLVRLDRIPIVLGRVYDSKGAADDDFGKGWKLSVAEVIRRRGVGLLYVDASGAEYPLDIDASSISSAHPHLTGITSGRHRGTEIELQRAGLIKRFRRVGDDYLLSDVRQEGVPGAVLKLEYDRNRVSRISATQGRFVAIERDGTGRIVAVSDDAGRQASYEYDRSGRLIAVVDVGQGRWSIRYDQQGLIEEMKDPRGATVLACSHDVHGRVRMVSVLHDSMLFDYRGSHTVVHNALQQSAVFWHDRSGLTRAAKDFAGDLTQLQFDEHLRPALLSFNGTTMAQLRYGDDGRLRTVIDSTGPSTVATSVSYDSSGRLSRIAAQGHVMASYGYDTAGNMVSAIDGDGARSYGYDQSNAPRKLSFSSIDLDLSYDMRGLLKEFSSTKQRVRIGYDLQDRVQELQFWTQGQYMHNRYSYGRLGLRSGGSYEIAGENYQSPGQTREAGTLEFVYDAIGNLTGLTKKPSRSAATSQTYIIGDRNELVSLLSSDGPTLTYDYDATGRPTRTLFRDREVKYDYDALGRLTGTSLNGRRLLQSNYGPMDLDAATEADGQSSHTTVSYPVASAIFGSLESIAYARTRGAPFGPIRFDATMARFVSAHSVVPAPDAAFLASLKRRGLPLPGSAHHGGYYTSAVAAKTGATTAAESTALTVSPAPIGFDKPSNGLFLPAEFSSLNCYVCSINVDLAAVVTTTINGGGAPGVQIGEPINVQTGWTSAPPPFYEPTCWIDFYDDPGNPTYVFYRPFVGIDFGDGTPGVGGPLGSAFQHSYSSSGIKTVESTTVCDPLLCTGPQFILTQQRPLLVYPPCGSNLALIAQTVATTPSNVNRRKLGVGEKVRMYVTPAPACTVSWTLSGAGSLSATTGNEITFTAHERASGPTVTASVNGYQYPVTFNVVEPASESAVKQSEISIPAGVAGAGMILETTVHPTDVSFVNVEIKELSGPATNISGYFTAFPSADLAHNANPSWTALSPGNAAGDEAAGEGFPTPWRSGGFQWDIPVRWRVIGSSNEASLPNRLQTFTLHDASGRVTVSKMGQTVTRSP